MNGVNLIPTRRRLARQRRARQRFWFFTTLIHAAILAVICIMTHVAIHPGDVVSAEEIEATAARIGEVNSKIAQNRKTLAEAEMLRQTAVAISDQADWSILLNLLGQTVGDEIVLRDIQLKPDLGGAQQYSLQLHGFGKSQPEVSQFVLRLQELGLLDEVKLTRTNRETVMNQAAVTFEISSLIRAGAKEKP